MPSPQLSRAPRSGPPRYWAAAPNENWAFRPVTGKNEGCSLYRSRTRLSSNSSLLVWRIASLYRSLVCRTVAGPKQPPRQTSQGPMRARTAIRRGPPPGRLLDRSHHRGESGTEVTPSAEAGTTSSGRGEGGEAAAVATGGLAGIVVALFRRWGRAEPPRLAEPDVQAHPDRVGLDVEPGGGPGDLDDPAWRSRCGTRGPRRPWP